MLLIMACIQTPEGGSREEGREGAPAPTNLPKTPPITQPGSPGAQVKTKSWSRKKWREDQELRSAMQEGKRGQRKTHQTHSRTPGFLHDCTF